MAFLDPVSTALGSTLKPRSVPTSVGPGTEILNPEGRSRNLVVLYCWSFMQEPVQYISAELTCADSIDEV